MLAGAPLARDLSALELLRRPGVGYADLVELTGEPDWAQPGVWTSGCRRRCVPQMEVMAKYEGYIERQQAEIERQLRSEETVLPDGSGLCRARRPVHGGAPEAQRRAPRHRRCWPRAFPGSPRRRFPILLVHLKKCTASRVRTAEWHERFHRTAGERLDAQRLAGVRGPGPGAGKIPGTAVRPASPIFQFNRAIIDATADLVCAYKPQFAHYAAYDAEDQLERTIEYIQQHHPAFR